MGRVIGNEEANRFFDPDKEQMTAEDSYPEYVQVRSFINLLMSNRINRLQGILK